jgi:glycosyltransferase involved in cell wall biosynthesis
VTGHILILHYTPPGIIGGVEHIIHEHLRLLQERGYTTTVVAGRAGDPEYNVHLLPEINAARPESVRIEAELALGVVSERFFQARQAILDALAPLVAKADAVIAHNAFTLHFSLPLTAVLWELTRGRAPGSMIGWCHDLSWTNPLYIPTMHPGYPWDLLRTPAPNTQYVTVSRERKLELEELWEGGLGPGDHTQRRPERGALWAGMPRGVIDPQVAVVPNGIDVCDFLRLSPETRDLVAQYRLFERDVVLLLPVRITRRKNIEAGIRAVRSLKDRGLDVRYLISGPQAPHHPARSSSYLEELKALRSELGVTEEVVFLADELGRNLEDRTVSELYAVSDVLLFPSASEGFGLPILEAGLARLPIVLSDIPIFREVGGSEVRPFDLDAPPDTIAASIVDALSSSPSRLYRRVLQEYRWEAIVDHKILPLLGPTRPELITRRAGEATLTPQPPSSRVPARAGGEGGEIVRQEDSRE